MRTTYVPGRWLVFFYDLERPPPSAVNVERLSVAPAVLAVWPTGDVAMTSRSSSVRMDGPIHG
ncbi:MAG: hypothetical protein DLM61_24965 [Pseudonocardiales bacterium]|nr:MAG: hypothetical protein DLM61_24965 [Pseudonocardiales bacterium]